MTFRHSTHKKWITWVTRLRMKLSMRVSVATDWIKPSLLTLSVQLQITSRLSACEAFRMTLQGRDRRSLSEHSSSVRGQLVLPGPSLESVVFSDDVPVFLHWAVWLPCVREHGQVSLGASADYWVLPEWPCSWLSSPLLSSPVFFSALCLKMLASILNTLQLWYCPHRQ